MNNYKYIEDKKEYTHLSYGVFTGKFNIPFDKSKEFIKLYIKAIKNNNLTILELMVASNSFGHGIGERKII